MCDDVNIFMIFSFQIDLPEEIIGLITLNIQPNEISIMWQYQMNGSSPRIGADVEVRKGIHLVTTIPVVASQNNLTISSILPLTIYEVTVFSVTTVGRSRPSSISVTTISLS